MDRQRLFYDPEAKYILWWKSLQEVVKINPEGEIVARYKIRLDDKKSISHGKFKAFLSYCPEQKIISFLGYQCVTCSFFTFSMSIETREELKHVAALGDFDNFVPQSFDLKFGYLAIGGLFTKSDKSHIVKNFSSTIKQHDAGAVFDLYRIDYKTKNGITHLKRAYIGEDTP